MNFRRDTPSRERFESRVIEWNGDGIE